MVDNIHEKTNTAVVVTHVIHCYNVRHLRANLRKFHKLENGSYDLEKQFCKPMTTSKSLYTRPKHISAKLAYNTTAGFEGEKLIENRLLLYTVTI